MCKNQKYAEVMDLLNSELDRYPELAKWRGQINYRAKKFFGQARVYEKVIVLCSWAIDHCTLDRVIDTIQHEIAHALEWERYRTAGHGWRWKMICRETGADPSPTHHISDEVRASLAKESKYTGTCPNCGRTADFHRKLKRAKACGPCCKKHAYGRYDARFKYVITQNY